MGKIFGNDRNGGDRRHSSDAGSMETNNGRVEYRKMEDNAMSTATETQSDDNKGVAEMWGHGDGI